MKRPTLKRPTAFSPGRSRASDARGGEKRSICSGSLGFSSRARGGGGGSSVSDHQRKEPTGRSYLCCARLYWWISPPLARAPARRKKPPGERTVWERKNKDRRRRRKKSSRRGYRARKFFLAKLDTDLSLSLARTFGPSFALCWHLVADGDLAICTAAAGSSVASGPTPGTQS